MKPGPTGKFPEGKISDDDEGELVMAVGHEEGNVIVKLGIAVTWFGLPPPEARAFAAAIIAHAEEIENAIQ